MINNLLFVNPVQQRIHFRLAAEKTGLAVYGPRFGRMPFGPHISEGATSSRP